MGEFIQYHNVDKLGTRPKYRGAKTGIYWTANRNIPKGARVWLVAGETDGGRKRYWLFHWFVVDELGEKPDGSRYARGTEMCRFEPPVEIGALPWFTEFRIFMGNFGRGLSPLRVQDIVHFEEAVAVRVTKGPARRVVRRRAR